MGRRRRKERRKRGRRRKRELYAVNWRIRRER